MGKVRRARGGRVVLVAALLIGAGACSTSRSSLTQSSSPTSESAPIASVATTPESPVTTSTIPPPTSGPSTSVLLTAPATTSSTATTIADGGSTTSSTAATPTTTPATAPPATPLPADEAPGPCAFTAPSASGAITWVQNGQLLSFDGSGGVQCLQPAVSASWEPRWAPTADRTLTSPNAIVSADATRDNGFPATAQAVSWSQPTGKALIDVDPVSHRLLWHSATSSQVQDISFLARTDEAVYHPAGKAIAAVGVDENGQYGVWLASNRGTDRQLITAIADPNTHATNLAFSADGNSLFFIHGVVHRLNMQGLILNQIGVDGRIETNLTVSTTDESFAFNTGACDATNSILTYPGVGPQSDLRSLPGEPFGTSTITPVGWLGGSTLVIAARPSGCDGPADVWAYTPGSGFTHIGASLSNVSIRIAHGAFQELPTKIDEAAPG